MSIRSIGKNPLSKSKALGIREEFVDQQEKESNVSSGMGEALHFLTAMASFFLRTEEFCTNGRNGDSHVIYIFRSSMAKRTKCWFLRSFKKHTDVSFYVLWIWSFDYYVPVGSGFIHWVISVWSLILRIAESIGFGHRF
ncbi:unnamed protein product [Rhizophagus irregularis]|nr:unnamed protein product [Rhizophagus irregularis]